MNEDVLFSIEERVATITFNRPEYGNAFSKASYQMITELVTRCYDDKDVGAVLFTGAGKHFSAGGDIKRFKMLIDTGEYLQTENIRRAGAMADAIRRCPKPTIAMVNGAAAGAGCSLALSCDFRIVSPASKLVMSFIKMGLSGDTGGMFYLQRLVGIAKTTEMMMLGDAVGGEEAYRLGLATRLADPEALRDEAYQFAKKLASSPLQAIRRQKSLLYEFFYRELSEYSVPETEYMVQCSHTADFEEAVNAFLEKRTPVFRGE